MARVTPEGLIQHVAGRLRELASIEQDAVTRWLDVLAEDLDEALAELLRRDVMPLTHARTRAPR